MEQKTLGQDAELLAQCQPFIGGWHLSRQKFFVLFILALVKAKTVCFTQLAPYLSKVQIASNHRRIQRFFADFDLEFSLIRRMLLALLGPQSAYRLSLDRTNWQFAGVDFNILLLSVITDQGLSVPLAWKMLPKRGNSNQQERIDLLQECLSLFKENPIAYLVADREFIGQQWFAFLIEKKIPFFIRIRENQWLQQSRKGPTKAFWLFHNLPLNTLRAYHKPWRLQAQWVYLAGLKRVNQKGQLEFVIIASYAFDAQALTHYARRWQIECLFKALKSSGFHLEDTHLLDSERLNKLLALVSIAFVWVYRIGNYQQQRKPIPIKTHQRRAQSSFRYGLDALTQALQFDFALSITFIKLLSCT